MKLQLSNELGGVRFLFLTGPISRSHHMTRIVLAENYEKPRKREGEREKGGERERNRAIFSRSGMNSLDARIFSISFEIG